MNCPHCNKSIDGKLIASEAGKLLRARVKERKPEFYKKMQEARTYWPKKYNTKKKD